MRVALVVWTRSSIIYPITDRVIIWLAVMPLVVAGATSFSSSGHAENEQEQSRASSPRVSPDGRHIAFVAHMANGSSGLYVVDVDGKNLRRLTNGYGGMQARSPDGSRLVFVRREGEGDGAKQSLVVINADGTGEHVINTGQKKNQSPSFSPDGKQILLVLDGEIGFGIFTINADGSNPRKIARGGYPAWSPDGKQIAFNGKADYADDASPLRIFVVNADGTQKRQVFTGNGLHECPAWSPDGKRIAYFAYDPEKVNGKWNAVVRIVNADGSGDVAVGAHLSPYLDEIPSWFPDGKRLAIQSNRDGAMGIYIIDLNGKTLARVAPPAQETKPRVYYVNPDWSPNGSTIAFESTRDGKEAVYTIQVDGSGLRQLTSGESHPSGQPRWSSDGRQIVFISSREGREGLFLMNADGSEQRRLTNTTIGGDFVPVLSPKGDQVAFVSSEDEKTRTTDIYVIRTDGTGRTRLTNCEESVCGGASWSPDGEKILFSKGQAMPKNFPSLSSEERTKVKARVNNSGDIFIMDRDGSHVRNLTNNNLHNVGERWSKDGKTIYFMSQREEAPNMYSMNVDGSNVRKVRDGSHGAKVSPDGKYFAYTKKVNEEDGLYLYELKTGKERLLISGPGQQRLTTDPLNDVNPRWSPDDKQILFQSARLGGFPHWRLFVMNADGSDQRTIGVEGGRDMFPEWSPKGDRIVFSSYRDGASKSDLYVMNADGSSLRRLMQASDMALTPSTLPEGHWEGAITRESKTWRVNLDIESRPTGPAALVDLVDYAVYDIPFTVTVESNKLRVERKQPTGSTVSFIGTVEGNTFSGEFTGVGITAPFTLKRTDKTPVVFKEEEVTFRNGDVTLAGTMIIPKGPGPHPAIVVTHGGGPDSRRKNAYRSDGYFFAHLGVAALIYDKRGVEKSTGDYQTASLEDLADDALAGVRLLKARKDIDGRHIGVMGTSQGGWISPLAATRSSDVAFIIVISAAGINPMDQSIFNIENVLKSEGYSPEVINRATELRNRLYARARTGSFDANFLADIEKAHTEPWFKLSELPYPVAPSLSEGARRFLLFEPAPTWEKVRVPVLALWGEDDIYLPAQRSMSIVEAALIKGGNKKYTLKVFPRAEHGLSLVRAPADGWDFPRAIADSRELIADWIGKQVQKKSLGRSAGSIALRIEIMYLNRERTEDIMEKVVKDFSHSVRVRMELK